MSKLIKNTEFIRNELGLSKENFADKIGIAVNSYEGYIKGGTPSQKTIVAICEGVNKITEKHPVLSKRFPKGIQMNEITDEDLAALSKESGLQIYTLHTDKFIGDYVCYYTSTNVEGDKTTHSGILQLTQGERENELLACAIFSLKSIEDAEKIHAELVEGNKSLLDMFDKNKGHLFEGTAILSPTLLWCTLSNASKTEHASLSFDLVDKITTRKPEKTFYGARGIVLSQTTGLSNQTTTFPICIMKKALTVSPNELTHYLHFNYSQIAPAQIAQLAEKATKFFRAQLASSEELDDQLINDLLSAFIKHEIKDLLNRHIFNSHYFIADEMTEFYKNIVRPIRKREENN